jgi:hypothetical protein
MFLFSSLLIGYIFKSSFRINLNNSEREKKRLNKDIKFAITSLSMNLLFMILNFPIEIYDFFPYYNTIIMIYLPFNVYF